MCPPLHHVLCQDRTSDSSRVGVSGSWPAIHVPSGWNATWKQHGLRQSWAAHRGNSGDDTSVGPLNLALAPANAVSGPGSVCLGRRLLAVLT